MKKLILSFVFMALSFVTFGQHITSQEAMRNAQKFLADRGVKTSQITETTQPVTRAAGEEEAYYIFNIGNDEGFVIASADSRTLPIFGYTDEGSFDETNIPDGLRFMLGEYTKQVKSIPVDYVPAKTTRAATKDYPAVAPLLTTKWGQDYPYYNQCPEFNGGKCVTGCVATAIAQIMNYWKYPEVLPAQGRYTSRGNHGSIEVPALPEYRINWNAIKDTYSHDGGDDEAAVENVAALMRYVGQSVHMKYSPHESGANFSYSISKDFGYNKFLFTDGKERLTENEWYSLLHNDLNNKRPVYLAGENLYGGGHAFVCDGYDGAGHYHINWGWDGNDNGYFLLEVIYPFDENTGGYFVNDFYHHLSAVFGFTPYELIVDLECRLEPTYDGKALVADLIHLCHPNGPQDFNSIFENYYFGVGVVKNDGSLFVIEQQKNKNRFIVKLDNTEIFSTLDDGEYKVVGLFKEKENEEWTVYIHEWNELELYKSGNNIVLVDKLKEYWDKAVFDFDVQVSGDMRAGHEQLIEVAVTNHGEKELKGRIYLGFTAIPSNPLYNSSGLILPLNLKPGQKDKVCFEPTVFNLTRDPGLYKFEIYWEEFQENYDKKKVWEGSFVLTDENGEEPEKCATPEIQIDGDKFCVSSSTQDSYCAYYFLQSFSDVSTGFGINGGWGISPSQIFELVDVAFFARSAKTQCSDFVTFDIAGASSYEFEGDGADLLSIKDGKIYGKDNESMIFLTLTTRYLINEQILPNGEFVPYEIKIPLILENNKEKGVINLVLKNPVLNSIKFQKIELNYQHYELHEGESVQLIATILPDGVQNEGVTWTSSNENVVTVDENGLVTYVGKGAAYVTATAGNGSGVSARCIFDAVVGIENITPDENTAVEIYTLDGKKVGTIGNAGKGIYIIRTKDGKAKKVVTL